MRVKPLTFDAPRVPIDAELAWLLRAAFANDPSPAPPNDSERALQVARATQLSGRIAARLGVWRGSSSSALAQHLSEDYFANVAKEALLIQAQERIAELAERNQVPAIPVKFGGLRLAGAVSRGSRVVADLDILLPEAHARDFWRALLEAGFVRTKTHEYPHQLEALVDPYGAVIDLHIHLPGVVVEKGGFATADQLIAHGLLTRSRGSVRGPIPGVLAAHAIVHALLQNRSTPQTYSPLRLLSDLMDLRCTDPGVVRDAASYLAPELRTTCETLERLCTSLAEGTFGAPSFEGTSEQSLLWHCLAARLDFDYADRLRAAGLANKFRDGSGATEIVRYIADLIYPAESALDFLYGPVTGTPARVRRRLFRPLDLALRVARRSLRSR